MLDSRYHIMYLSIIFLMLGFGILIGSSLTLPAQIVQQQRTLHLLQEQVDGAVQDGKVARDRLEQMEDAIEAMRPRLVHNVLAGSHVEVIQCSDYPEATRDAETALQDAGASVTTIAINDRLIDLPDNQQNYVSQQIAPLAPNMTADVDFVPSLASTLSQSLETGGAANSNAAAIVKVLQTDHLISISGDVAALSQPCTLFVMIGGRDDNGIPDQSISSEVESQIVEQLTSGHNGSTSVVGCEPLDVDVSSIPVYQKEDIATVDCIDEPLGQLDLPYALHGDHSDYGLKTTAKTLLPQEVTQQTAP